jgi:uncharacterized damage-inducible protein DinB
MSVESLFLTCSVAKLSQLAGRIEHCLRQLTPEQIWARGAENENAIGNLVLHLNGNVRQWIVSTLGGEPDLRDRDSEFAARGGAPPEELAKTLRDTVERGLSIISQLTTAQLTRVYLIQKYEVSGVEAVFHVVEHFSQHTGQIIFATKMITGNDLGFYRHLSAATHNQTTP